LGQGICYALKEGEHLVLLAKILLKRAALFLITICAGGMTSVLSLWWNARLGGIIDTISTGNYLTAEIIVGAIVTILLTSAAVYAKGLISGFTCESLSHDLRMGYARHFASMQISEVEVLSTGEQISRLQNEIADTSEYLNTNLFQLLDDSIRFVATIIWLLLINPMLTLSAYLPVLIILIYVVWSSKAINAATRHSLQAKVRMNEHAYTLLTMFPIIRLYDATKMLLGGYTDALQTWEHQTIRAERTRARLMSLSALLSTIPLMILFGVGGKMAIGGAITIGTLYIFLNLSGNVSGVMMNMPGYIASFRRFSVNMKRLKSCVLLDEKGQ
jgi:ABC-type multidrug transport system fused ATPase/permease subunit